MNVRRIFVGMTLLVSCGVAACIIGPKQDDPLEDKGLMDGGTSADSGGFVTTDSGIAAADDAAPPPSDTSTPSGDATVTDAASDAADGGDAADASDTNDASDAPETD